jgi:hydrogenase/urease accessory protein HupE
MFAAITTGTSFGPFFRLGVEHIFTGYDHLLFLLGLLLVCTRWRTLVVIVTCFTVGHSLTLALATLGWVNLPPGVTEPLIALTILWVGLENIWRRGTEPVGRWAVTLLFGLVHGFGFATVLRDLGVGAEGGGLLVPLLAFNLGVEFGQLVFAAVVLPLLWWLRRFPWFVQRGVPVLSGVIAFTGLYWLVERVLLG